MNIYDCRFIDDDDKVTHIKQYGNSEKEICLFWNEWWPMHYKNNPTVGKYVDCKLHSCCAELKNYDERKDKSVIESIIFADDNSTEKRFDCEKCTDCQERVFCQGQDDACIECSYFKGC